MYEKLQDSLNEVLSWANTTKDFIKTEAPLVVKELLTYNFYYCLVCIIFWPSLISIAGYYLHTFISNWTTANLIDKDFYTFLQFIVIVIAGFLNLIIISCNGESLLKIYFAPRIYVIDYLSRLLERN